MSPLERLFDKVGDWIDAPRPAIRLELVRMFAPLAILGFMSGRLIHVDEWIGDSGFRVPKLMHNGHQPLWVPPLPNDLAWVLAIAMVVSGVFVAAGYRTRPSALVFVATLVFVALSDRPAAFTVSKIGPVIMLAVACGPAGERFGVDAWLRLQRGEEIGPKVVPLGPVRFFQLFLAVFYCASGVAKGGSDWITTPLVLFSHVHDSYQTPISFFIAQHLPGRFWTPMQYSVLVYEMGAPILFSWSRTRLPQLLYGVAMHIGIGLMFGPVIWFAVLMITLLLAAYSPDSWAEWLDEKAMKVMRKARPAAA
jgi:uncharacterized membrane protein YphA (DoxX/SURF4 family)